MRIAALSAILRREHFEHKTLAKQVDKASRMPDYHAMMCRTDATTKGGQASAIIRKRDNLIQRCQRRLWPMENAHIVVA
jgi:hypothetical protein